MTRSELLAEADEGPTNHDERARGAVPEPIPSSSVGEAVNAMQHAVASALDEEGDSTGAADAGAAPTLRRAVPGHGFEETDLDITDDGHHDREFARREQPHPVSLSDAPSAFEPSSDGARSSLAPLTPTPSVARPSVLGRLSSFGDPRFSSSGGGARRPSFARWTIGLVMLGVATVVAFTLVKRYLPSAEPTPSASPHDARVDKFLRAGQARLAAGDLEAAREQFVMASGVSDTDARVLQALADIEVIRADVAWLRLKLLGADDPARGAAEQELTRATKRAEEASDRAAAAAPKDRGTLRLRISVLRLRGDRDGARSLVEQLRDPSPEDALVLAALDLGEKDPSWPSVIDRLQTAARAEQRLGRGRAMLVYALARAGQKDAAGKELELLASYSPPHPLLDLLRRFVEGSTASAALGEDAGAAGPGSSSEPVAGGEEDVPTDFREALRRAHAARAEGKLDRAEALYRAALDKSPGNSEALEGIAELARARGDNSAAIAAYESLLRKNSAYLPAMAALADLKWQTGARAEATALYRQVIEAAPDSSYAKHAQSRLESSSGSSAATTTAPAPASTSGSRPATTAAPTSSLPPGVDVSDLPELR